MALESCWNRWLFWQKARRSLPTGILQRDSGSKKSLSGITSKSQSSPSVLL